MGRYADLETLIADLIPEVTSVAQKAAVGRVLDGASAFIDEFCRRPPGFFDASPALPSIKLIRGENRRFLRLPPHIPATVTVTGIAAAAYYESEQGWLYYKGPQDSGYLTEYAAAGNVWHADRLYEVSARWGYAATPPVITEAARQLTLKLWETQRGILGDLTPTGFVVERAMPLFVRESLNLYRRREFGK